MVERDNPGLKLDRLEHKLGIRASDTANFVLDDCRIPKENLLGSPEIEPKRGFAGVMQTFDNTRPLVAGMAIGVARACLERTRELLDEAGVEIDYDAPPHAQGAAASEFIAMESDWEAARLLTLQAAWMADNKKPNSLQASMAKAKAGRTGTDIALRCVALCGVDRLRRGRAAREVGPRRQDPRPVRGHPADPAADRRAPAAREDLRRAEVDPPRQPWAALPSVGVAVARAPSSPRTPPRPDRPARPGASGTASDGGDDHAAAELAPPGAATASASATQKSTLQCDSPSSGGHHRDHVARHRLRRLATDVAGQAEQLHAGGPNGSVSQPNTRA